MTEEKLHRCKVVFNGIEYLTNLTNSYGEAVSFVKKFEQERSHPEKHIIIKVFGTHSASKTISVNAEDLRTFINEQWTRANKEKAELKEEFRSL